MRALSLTLIACLAVTAAAEAAPRRKGKNENPPTAPLPVTTGAPTRPVEAQPIGTKGPAPTLAPPSPAAIAATEPATPPAPPPVPVIGRAVACLRAEAPVAAKVEPSAKLAVDLLLEDLCGVEVERAALYTHNVEALARFTPQSERTAAGLNGARVDPESGEIVNPPAGDVSGALSANGLSADLTPPAPMRRFAAELVLLAKATPPAKPVEVKKGH